MRTISQRSLWPPGGFRKYKKFTTTCSCPKWICFSRSKKAALRRPFQELDELSVTRFDDGRERKAPRHQAEQRDYGRLGNDLDVVQIDVVDAAEFASAAMPRASRAPLPVVLSRIPLAVVPAKAVTDSVGMSNTRLSTYWPGRVCPWTHR